MGLKRRVLGPSPQLGSWWRNYRWTDWLGRTQDGQYDPEPKFGGKRRVRAPEQVVLELPFAKLARHMALEGLSSLFCRLRE